MSTFTVVNEETLATAVSQCKHRLVYIAPGITQKVVTAMQAVMERPQPPALTVIIDTDPEVCRLGYGTVEGLKALQALAAGQMLAIRYQAGLRLGVLVADDLISVYSPTPLLIEAGSARADQPNAIALDAGNPLERVLKASAAEGETDASTPLPSKAEVGRQPATPDLLQKSLQELERLPPKPFDLARIERVYSSKLQYVDFEVTGYKLADRRVRVPNDLLVGPDETLNARLRNSFSLLESKQSIIVKVADVSAKNGQSSTKDGSPVMVDYSEATIERDRKKIYEDFLTPVPGHGQLISKSRRPAFDSRITWFTARVTAYSEGVKEKLKEAIEASIQNLTDALLPGLIEHPPERLLKRSLSEKPKREVLREALRLELTKAFGAGDGFYQPKIKVVYKDLTYETIKDQAFRDLLQKSFPGLGDQGVEGLFEEHDAVPEHPGRNGHGKT
jgi:hypothetical protein